MNRQTSRKWLWIDPRSKMLILLICVVAATTAPNLTYEMGLVLIIAVFALLSGDPFGNYRDYWICVFLRNFDAGGSTGQ